VLLATARCRSYSRHDEREHGQHSFHDRRRISWSSPRVTPVCRRDCASSCVRPSIGGESLSKPRPNPSRPTHFRVSFGRSPTAPALTKSKAQSATTQKQEAANAPAWQPDQIDLCQSPERHPQSSRASIERCPQRVVHGVRTEDGGGVDVVSRSSRRHLASRTEGHARQAASAVCRVLGASHYHGGPANTVSRARQSRAVTSRPNSPVIGDTCPTSP
jgi:hypothetical protein